MHLKELRSFRKYRPCVDKDGRVRIEGHLSKFPDVAVEAKHSLVIPSNSGTPRGGGFRGSNPPPFGTQKTT